MNKTELKKALYKEKPVAIRQLDFGPQLWCYYTVTSIGPVHFAVPVSDMGNKLFEDKIPAQLLIRWIMDDKPYEL